MTNHYYIQMIDRMDTVAALQQPEASRRRKGEDKEGDYRRISTTGEEQQR